MVLKNPTVMVDLLDGASVAMGVDPEWIEIISEGVMEFSSEMWTVVHVAMTTIVSEVMVIISVEVAVATSSAGIISVFGSRPEDCWDSSPAIACVVLSWEYLRAFLLVQDV